MPIKLDLPALVETRDKADVLLDSSQLPSLASETVIINGRAVKSVGAPFADELVRLLALRGVREVTVVDAPDQLIGYLNLAARNRRFVAIKLRAATSS
jgi:hypothetical protein